MGRAFYRSCTSCLTLFMCTVCYILNKFIILIIIIKGTAGSYSLQYAPI